MPCHSIYSRPQHTDCVDAQCVRIRALIHMNTYLGIYTNVQTGTSPCTCIVIHAHAYIHRYKHTHIQTYVHTEIQTYTHTYTSIYFRYKKTTHAYVHMYMHARMSACMHTYIQTLTHTHSCTHTHIHTHSHTNFYTPTYKPIMQAHAHT